MIHKIDFSLASSDEIENTLSRQIEAIRLHRNITQARLAKEAGVSRSTITRLAQDGKGISLNSFIRILMALQMQGHLQALLPSPTISPLKRLKLAEKERQRARSKKSERSDWNWGNQEVGE